MHSVVHLFIYVTLTLYDNKLATHFINAFIVTFVYCALWAIRNEWCKFSRSFECSRGDNIRDCIINNCNASNKGIKGLEIAQFSVRVQRKASYLGILNPKGFMGQEVFGINHGKDLKGCCAGADRRIIVDLPEHAGKKAQMTVVRWEGVSLRNSGEISVKWLWAWGCFAHPSRLGLGTDKALAFNKVDSLDE